jgi:hypothetical protein
MAEGSKFIVDIYSLMLEKRILLSYMGDISEDVTDTLLQLLKSSDILESEVSMKKKMYKIVVECLENITRHTAVPQKSDYPSIFLIGRDHSHYHIVSGNYVKNEFIPLIEDALTQINSCDRAQIKEKHFQALMNSSISEKGGAGIGLVDIALKSGNKLDYEFTSADQGFSFYTLNVKITINNHIN